MASGQSAGRNQPTEYVTADVQGRLAEFVRGMVTKTIGWFLEAEDFIQEAWVTALEQHGQFEGESEDDFVAWLCGIAHNKYRNACRKHEVTRRQTLYGESRKTLDSFEARHLPPDTHLAQTELHELANAAIQEVLTGFEALLVDLVILKGCTVTHLASSCSINRKRLDRGLSRALRKLAQHLDRIGPGMGESTVASQRHS